MRIALDKGSKILVLRVGISHYVVKTLQSNQEQVECPVLQVLFPAYALDALERFKLDDRKSNYLRISSSRELQ